MILITNEISLKTFWLLIRNLKLTETIVFRAFAMDLIDGLKLLCVEIGFFLKEITVKMCLTNKINNVVLDLIFVQKIMRLQFWMPKKYAKNA